MTDIWGEKPNIQDDRYWMGTTRDIFMEDRWIEDGDAWLEKVKAQWDRERRATDLIDDALGQANAEIGGLTNKLEAVEKWYKQHCTAIYIHISTEARNDLRDILGIPSSEESRHMSNLIKEMIQKLQGYRDNATPIQKLIYDYSSWVYRCQEILDIAPTPEYTGEWLEIWIMKNPELWVKILQT